MDIEINEAERWEMGCREDTIRNNIVVPKLADLIETTRPSSILDVGCATGYISRSIQQQISYKPFWYCLDNNASRIEYAKSLKPLDMSIEYIAGDFLNIEINNRKFDIIIFSFTILEIGITQNLLSQIIRYSNANGRVVFVLPDVWVDILLFAQTEPRLPEQFLGEQLSLQKIDKFTGLSYPFNVTRLETVISQILQVDFVLEKLDKYESDQNSIFLLTFRR